MKCVDLYLKKHGVLRIGLDSAPPLVSNSVLFIFADGFQCEVLYHCMWFYGRLCDKSHNFILSEIVLKLFCPTKIYSLAQTSVILMPFKHKRAKNFFSYFVYFCFRLLTFNIKYFTNNFI